MVIFEKSQSGRCATAQVPAPNSTTETLDPVWLRQDKPVLPEMSELDVIRHFTQLSQKNFCVDTQFYPLGSCTMKYNPRGVQHFAMQSAFLQHHPLFPTDSAQGILACLYELQEYLKIITGMPFVSLTPMAGAQGEFAGCAMIRAYHQARKDNARVEMLVSDAAHGTNPASAAMTGFVVKEIPTTQDGDIDLTALQQLVGPHTAGVMLTNPSTLGVFDRSIIEVARIVHAAGGLLYYDGANMNAILGRVRPAEMGFDVVHINTHKTFATPHGGGGPGSGPVAVNDKLRAFLPIPIVAKKIVAEKTEYYLWEEEDCPESIGRLSTFMGNVGVLLRAYIYIRLLGEVGLKRVANYATLNANYLQQKLQEIGFTIAFPQRRVAHEFIITLAKEAKTQQVTALDVGKRILDFGFYAPTMYFPLLIPECLLIEPTETESKQTLDAFIAALKIIWHEIQHSPEKVCTAPSRLACKRLDEVNAARNLDLVWHEKKL